MNGNYDNTYNIKEFATGSVTNRSHFELSSHSETLIGTDEAYQSLFNHTNDIINYANGKELQGLKRSVTGYSGEVWTDSLLLDIDVKADLPKAQQIAKELLERFKNEYDVDCTQLTIYFSGNKGFHIVIPAELFNGFNPSKELPRLQSEIVRKLTTGYENFVDLDIYYTVSLIRIHNTKNGKSGLFAIPLTIEELSKCDIETIKEMSKEVRTVQYDHSNLLPNKKLEELKQLCELNLHNIPTKETCERTLTNCDIKNWEKIVNNCNVMKFITQKSADKQEIHHDERVFLGTVATAFGVDGIKKAHSILEGQLDYNPQTTQYYMENMANNHYKPTLCLSKCGANGLCKNIKDINRKSPIAFAFTYDKKFDKEIENYIESYVLDKISNNFKDLIFAAIDESFYEYKDGVYKVLSDEDVKARLEDFLPYYIPDKLITNGRLNNLVERMKTRNNFRFNGKFNDEMYKINLKNGIFDLRTGKLHQHTPEIKSNIQLPFAYNPLATCTEFDRFLMDIFDEDQDKIDYLLKFFCYLMIPTYSFQKILVWIGSGRNGKGTLSRVITGLLGTVNVSNEDIHDLANQRFSKINLKDKLVNFSTELKSSEVEMGMIKKLSGGDMIAADIKFKNTVTFLNYARLIISANELPRFSEVGNAVLERFEFITFPKQYNASQMDTKLDDKLSAELSGIFNKITAKYNEIIRPDGSIYFETPDSIKKSKQIILPSLNTVIEFIQEECVTGEHASVRIKNIYSRYSQWTKDCGYKPLSKKKFIGVLSNTCNYKVENSSTDNNQVTVLGIELKPYSGSYNFAASVLN